MTSIIEALDKEIVQLKQVRAILIGDVPIKKRGPKSGTAGDATTPGKKQRRGRPKGSKNKAVSFDPEQFAPKSRTISPEGRERIAAAQRARWALKKKKTRTTKKSAGKAALKKASAPAARKTVKGSLSKAAATKGSRNTADASHSASARNSSRGQT